MLQTIRERAQGWIAGVIVFLICIPFALWGVNSYMDGVSSVEVAEVNGEPLGLQEYQQAFERYRRQLQAMFGEQMDINAIDPQVLKSEALNQLVNETLLRQYADREGVRISDEQLAAAIQSFPAFQQDAQFSSDLYESRLRTTGMSARGFESELRADMLVEQIRQGLADTAYIADSEAQRLFRLRNQRRDIRWAIIDGAPFRASANITDEAVKGHYEENGDLYRTEETVSLEYLELSVDSIAAEISTSDEELKSWFENNRDEFFVDEERSANHILIQLAQDASDAEVEVAMEKARAAKSRVLGGEAFEELAKELSDDIGSSAAGGETGFFGRNVMAPEFEEAVFSMSPGDISDPIRTEFGLHIIRLNEVKEGGVKPFEELKSEVAGVWARKQAEQAFIEQVEELATITYEQPGTLEPAAQALDLKVRTTEAFSKNSGAGIAADPKVAAAAFSEEVLLGGANSDVLELGPDRVVVARVLEHSESAMKPLEEVAEEIRESLVNDSVREATVAMGESLLDQLDRGFAPEALSAAEKPLVWEKVERASRSDPKVTRAVVRKAFALGAPGEDNKPVYGGVPLGTGDYALIEVSAVEEGAAVNMDSREAREALKSLQQTRSLSEWQLFLATLAENADIKRYENKL